MGNRTRRDDHGRRAWADGYGPRGRPHGRGSWPGIAPAPVTKFSNRKVTTDEGTFDSEVEYRRWCGLKILVRVGDIADLERQVRFPLDGMFSARGRQLYYVADFTYRDCATSTRIIEDVKGFVTATAVLKASIMRAQGHDVRFLRFNRRLGTWEHISQARSRKRRGPSSNETTSPPKGSSSTSS